MNQCIGRVTTLLTCLILFTGIIFPVSVAASPYDCNGVWSNVPCDKRVAVVSKESAISPASRNMYDCDGVWSSVPCDDRVAAPPVEELTDMIIDPASNHMYDCEGVWSSHPCDGEEEDSKPLKKEETSTKKKKDVYLCGGVFQKTPCKKEEKEIAKPATTSVPSAGRTYDASGEEAFFLDTENAYSCTVVPEGAAVSVVNVKAEKSGASILISGQLKNESNKAISSPVFLRVRDDANRQWITEAARPMQAGGLVRFAVSYNRFSEMPPWIAVSLYYEPAEVCPMFVVPVS